MPSPDDSIVCSMWMGKRPLKIRNRHLKTWRTSWTRVPRGVWQIWKWSLSQTAVTIPTTRMHKGRTSSTLSICRTPPRS